MPLTITQENGVKTDLKTLAKDFLSKEHHFEKAGFKLDLQPTATEGLQNLPSVSVQGGNFPYAPYLLNMSTEEDLKKMLQDVKETAITDDAKQAFTEYMAKAQEAQKILLGALKDVTKHYLSKEHHYVIDGVKIDIAPVTPAPALQAQYIMPVNIMY